MNLAANPAAYNKTGGVYLQVQDKIRDLLQTPHGNKFYEEYLKPWLQLDFELYERAKKNV